MNWVLACTLSLGTECLDCHLNTYEDKKGVNISVHMHEQSSKGVHSEFLLNNINTGLCFTPIWPNCNN